MTYSFFFGGLGKVQVRVSPCSTGHPGTLNQASLKLKDTLHLPLPPESGIKGMGCHHPVITYPVL